MRIEAEIERFIVDELVEEDLAQIDPDESLIERGLLDSIAVLRLMAFIEEQFGVTVDEGDVVPDNFETINSLKVFLERKIENNHGSPERGR